MGIPSYMIVSNGFNRNPHFSTFWPESLHGGS